MKSSIVPIAFFVILLGCSKPNTSTTNSSTNNTASLNGWIKLSSSNDDFGSGLTPLVTHLCCDNNDQLYASGYFFGGLDGYFVAKWEGGSWHRVGTDQNALNAQSPIVDICVNSNGKLFANNVIDVNGVNHISLWNGTNWINILNNPTVQNDLLFNDNQGNIYFTHYGTDQYDLTKLFKWNGLSWSQCGNCPCYSGVVTSDYNGNLFLAGVLPDGSKYFAKYDGINWVSLGSPNNYNEPIRNVNNSTITFCSNKYGVFWGALSSASSPSILKWQNNQWYDLGFGNGFHDIVPYLLCCNINNTYIMRHSDQNDSLYLAKFNSNNQWENVSQVFPSSTCNQIITNDNDKVYAIGSDGIYMLNN